MKKRPPPKADNAPDGAQNMTVRIQCEKLRALDDFARRKGTTRSAIVQRWIADMLELEAAKHQSVNDTKPRGGRQG